MNKLEKLHEEVKKLLEVLRMNKQIYNLLEKCREEIENLYGRDTDLTEEITDMMEKLEQQLTNGWIPVSERLPEEGRYLVTTVYGEVKESEFDLKKWWQIDNSTISLEWEEEPIKVVAWQPLPEPYKEVSE